MLCPWGCGTFGSWMPKAMGHLGSLLPQSSMETQWNLRQSLRSSVPKCLMPKWKPRKENTKFFVVCPNSRAGLSFLSDKLNGFDPHCNLWFEFRDKHPVIRFRHSLWHQWSSVSQGSVGKRRLQDLGSVVRQIRVPPCHVWRVPAAGDSINSNEDALPVAGIELFPDTLEFTAQEWI